MKLALIGTGKIIEDALFAMEPVENNFNRKHRYGIF